MKKADRGATENLPGVDIPFEAPESAAFVFDPAANETNLELLVGYLSEQHIFPLQ